MTRFRALAFLAAVAVLGGLVVAFVLTGRPDNGVSGQDARPALSVGPSTPGLAATSPAAGPVPTRPYAPPTTAASQPGEDPAEPTATPKVDPAALEAATAFAAAWLNAADPEWAHKLQARSTPDLGQAWVNADPGTVPVGTVGGPIVGHTVAPGLADVHIPVVDRKGGPVGLLTVEVTATGNGWLVSDVDWVRAA